MEAGCLTARVVVGAVMVKRERFRFQANETSYSVKRQAEELRRIGGAGKGHMIEWLAAQVGDPRSHRRHVGRLVAFAPPGHRRQEGAVGLHQVAIGGHPSGTFMGFVRLGKGDIDA